jgi:DUF4097 and DUF4098 domain-containing protein YvlB
MNRAIVAGALVALCACNVQLGDRVHEDYHQSIDTGATPVVHVDNIAGMVTVEPWAKPVVNIAATKYGSDMNDVRNVTIGVHRAGDGIFIVTTYSGVTRGGGVSYRISVPAGASVQVSNVAGAASIGAVTGNVSVVTQAGAIDASLGRVEGRRTIALSATAGGITLRISSASSASVDATSTVGAFSSDVPGILQSRTNFIGASASGKVGAGTARIKLTTTTGAISLKTTE